MIARLLALTAVTLLIPNAAQVTGAVARAQPTPDDSRPPPGFHVAPAVLQMGILVGLGVAWYEWQIELNKQDFDFSRTFGDQLHRLAGRGYRFDNNERYLNIGHVPAGAFYYQVARVHGAGMGAAFLFDVATSTFWETVVEHREVISLNDQLFTGVAGVPLGEALFRISDVFARSKPTITNRVLSALASPMRIGAWLAGENPTPSGAYNAQGIDEAVFHRFALSLGALADLGAAPDAPWTAGSVRGDFEVIALPGYGPDHDDPATQARVRGGDLSRLTVQYAGTASRFRAFDLVARTVVWGLFDRTVAVTAQGASSSTSRTIGLASSYDLSFDRAAGITDFLSVLHVLGPSLDVAWARDRLMIRGDLSAYADFAMVRPMAIGRGVMPSALEGTKSTLPTEQYYYGWGATGAAQLDVMYGRLRGGAAAEWNHFDSIEGLDRYRDAFVSPTGVSHDAVADDSNLTDTRMKLRFFLHVPAPFVRDVGLELDGVLLHRRGDWPAKGLAGTQNDRRLALAMTYTL